MLGINFIFVVSAVKRKTYLTAERAKRVQGSANKISIAQYLLSLCGLCALCGEN